MKIRFVTPPDSKQIGGIQHAVEGLTEALQSQDIEVIIGGDPDDEDALHHFHGLWDPSHSQLAVKLRDRNRPYVVSPHGMLEPWAFHHRRWKKLPYFWLIEQRYLFGAQALFVTSEMEANNLLNVIRHPRMEMIPLGCRGAHGPGYSKGRKLLRWSKKERFILYLSRIDKKKGLDLLIQGMVDGDFQWKGWHLVIVGDGDISYVASLKTFADQNQSRLPEISWVGPVWGAERWKYIQAADLFCLPTHSENFGLAVLEALHVGTPVLTTDQTPWVEFKERDGLFIARPEGHSIQKTLQVARNRVKCQWSIKDRNNLAAWADDRFAWDKLAPLYVEAYRKNFKLPHI